MKFNPFALLMLFLQLSIPGSKIHATEITAENLRTFLETKNSRIAAAKLEAVAATNLKRTLVRTLLPDVELYGAQETFKVGNQDQTQQPTYGAEAKINIYNGGQDQLQTEIINLESERADFNFLKTQAEELATARTLYWQILYAKANLALLKSALAVNLQNIKSAERRILNGVATESDRVEFEMQTVALNLGLETANLNLKIYLRNLAALLNFDDPSQLQFSENLTHEHDVDALLAQATKAQAYLFKETELLSDIKSLEAHKQKRLAWPKLDAFAAHNQYNQREKDPAAAEARTESVLGVRVSVNLSSVFESHYQSTSLFLASQSAKLLAGQIKKEVEVQIKNETDELTLLHNQVHAAEANIARAEKYYKLTQSEYSRGVKNSPDVLGASEKLYEMKNKLNEILRDFQITKTRIFMKIEKQ